MRRITRVLGAAAAAAVSIAGLSPARGAGQAPAAKAPIAFSVPSVVDPIHTNGEPDIGINPKDQSVYVSGPTGTGTQRSTWFGSVDGGRSYRVITPGPPPTAISSIQDPPGGGDTDLNFDHTGKQYFSDLYALACLRVATTSNDGASVDQNIYPGGCAGIPGADRQWLAVFDPPGGHTKSAYKGPFPLVYQEYNDVVNLVRPARWTKSLDGLTYTSASPTEHFGSDGYPAIDQTTGKVFQAAAGPDGTSLYLNIGTPNVDGSLTFRDDPGQPGLIKIADGFKGNPDTLFSVLSIDSARNLHVVSAVNNPSNPADDQVFVSVASAKTGWTQWATPVQVSHSPSLVNVFPWIKSGGAGRDDAVWYGSDKNVDPSSHNNQSWNVFMSQTVWPVDASGAVTLASPSQTQVKVSPHPMHYDDICLQGSACITSKGNRNLADFFVITADRTGAAEVVYDDTSNGLSQAGFTPGNMEILDHKGAGVITVARQSSGPGLLGTAVSGTSNSPVSGISDPAGDAKYPVIGGTNVPAMDLLDSRISLQGGKLVVTAKVANLSPTATAAAEAGIPGAAYLQYVTRWQLGNTIYYAGMSMMGPAAPSFYAGAAKSVDLCSVSACFPHVITYPEPGVGGTSEGGSVSCPAFPSSSHPCTVTISVNPSDVGSPSTSSLLEEVGLYSFATSHLQGVTTNAQAEADNVPLEVDGACCYNTRPSARGGGAGGGSDGGGGGGGGGGGAGGGDHDGNGGAGHDGNDRDRDGNDRDRDRDGSDRDTDRPGRE